jgi:DNA-binding response OmpR family regulator
MESGVAARLRRDALRVLIADDDPDVADSFALLLELDGHECASATDGESAYRLFKQIRPDVVLLDIAMPGWSGHDVARNIRALVPGRQALLIAVTGWARESDKARSYAAGFDYHFVKPVEYGELASLLRAMARTRRTRAATSLVYGTKCAAHEPHTDRVINTS